jgi:iron complex outermembrane recepter protein
VKNLLPVLITILVPFSALAATPGSVSRIVSIDNACPTFSWAPIQGAVDYELAVYAFGDAEPVPLPATEPSLRQTVPGSTTSWTPSSDRCLSPGNYGWSVRGRVAQGVTNWTELMKFRVEHSAASAGSVFGEEVIVTAQKRSENIRDVPISITALTGDQVEDAGVTSSLELPALVPGLKMDRVGSSTIPAIRGVSSYITNVGVDNNVAMYIDDVYVSSGNSSTLELPDISRIEVLKGPQGTLFGRNATGGAIRIFTKDPQMTSMDGDFSFSYGSFNNQAFKGYLSGPIVPGKLAASITGYKETGSSYYHNLTPDVPRQKVDNSSVRAKLLYTPADNTRILFSASTDVRRDPAAILFFPLEGITVARDVPGAVIPTRPYDIATDIPTFEHASHNGASIQLSRSTSAGDLRVIGAWSLAKSTGPVSLVAAAYPDPYTGMEANVNDRSEAWTGEVNFASRKFGKLSFISGANYYDKSAKWNPLQVLQNVPGNVFDVSIFAGQTTRAYALYGEATYQLTDKLRVIGGLRYSNEESGATGSVVAGIQPEGQFYDWGSRTFDRVTQRLSVLYDAAPKTNLYFTYSTGFKSGNFIPTSIPFGVTPAQCDAANAAAAGSCVYPPVLKPETITAFEGGIKSAPRPWLQLDAALFAYKISDIQIQSYENVCLQTPCPPNPLVQLSEYSNAAAGRMLGAELNVDAQVTSALQVRTGISLLDAKFSDYENASWVVPAPGGVGMVQTPTTSASGKRLPRAPRATLSLSGIWTSNLHSGVFSFQVDGYASDRTYYDVGNVFSQPSYTTLALRATFRPASMPHLSAAVWGNNVTGTRVILGTILGSSGANVSFAAPATYGVTLGYTF